MKNNDKKNLSTKTVEDAVQTLLDDATDIDKNRLNPRMDTRSYREKRDSRIVCRLLLMGQIGGFSPVGIVMFVVTAVLASLNNILYDIAMIYTDSGDGGWLIGLITVIFAIAITVLITSKVIFATKALLSRVVIEKMFAMQCLGFCMLGDAVAGLLVQGSGKWPISHVVIGCVVSIVGLLVSRFTDFNIEIFTKMVNRYHL